MTDFDFTPDALEAAGALEPTPDPGYRYPTDPAVAENLERWRDAKVGVIIHWGIYTSIRQGGSWSLHRQHLGAFTDPPADWSGTDAQHHTWYNDQARGMCGRDFDAADWARVCADAGMRYCVFTTKHHDGFAMYDTEYSNFKSTAEDAGLGRDIVREVPDAFRAEGLDMGLYFSKADWNHPGYWDRSRPIENRLHNFDIDAHPRKWASFVEYTQAQLEELLANYGDVNVLWLDAGWVHEPVEPIGMDQIAARARELQPGILVVDREVHGCYEDYRTPEQEIPDGVLDYPWESCITLTRTWCCEQPNDPAKPLHRVLSDLVAIVGRGGNYLIGIGPDETGAMSQPARERLAQLGQWLRVNGEGIYGTRPWAGAEGVAGSDGWVWTATARDGHFYLLGARDDEADATSGRVRCPVALAAARVVGGGSASVAEDAHDVVFTGAPGPHAVVLEVTPA